MRLSLVVGYPTMGGTPRGKSRQFNAFSVGEAYLFKCHFEQDIFKDLDEYYNVEEYRFEVPRDRMPRVERLLKANHYDITLIDEPERFCVVRPKDQNQPEWLFTKSVLRGKSGYHHVYLLEDLVAVEEEVYRGIDRLSESKVEDPI